MYIHKSDTTATITLGVADSCVTFRTKQKDGGFSEIKLPPDYAKKLGQRLVALSDILLKEDA